MKQTDTFSVKEISNSLTFPISLSHEFKIRCPEDEELSPCVTCYLIWNGGQCHDSIGLARVDLSLKGYLEKYVDGKQ